MKTDNRIAQRLAANRAAGRKSFVAYLSAGDPHLDATVELACALDAVGVDVLELGVPFSDPMADGIAIQASYERALKAGCTMRKVIDAVRRIRARSQLPLLLFTYLNPVLAYGVEAFAHDAAAAGADGVLLLDLPPEQDPAMLRTMQQAGLATVCLAAPTTTVARRRFLAANSRGFLYYICRLGVTGERTELPPDLAQRVAELKRAADIPVCIGFGISTPEQAAAAARCGDGAVVGSHFVKLIERHGASSDLVRLVAARAKELATAVHAVG
ncbi:MAG: tryptophan synthase subunit alpha [Planctomycetota bacterium]